MNDDGSATMHAGGEMKIPLSAPAEWIKAFKEVNLK